MKQALGATISFSFVYGLMIVLQQKIVRTTISPLHLNFLAYLIASGFMITILLLFNKKAFQVKSKVGLNLAIIAAITGSVIADMAVLLGLQYSSSINWSLLQRLTLFVTFFILVFFLKEKITKFKIYAIIISIIGAYLVILKPNVVFTPNIGDLLFMIAVISFSISNVVTQQASRYLKSSQITLIRLVTTTILLGIITLIFYPIRQINNWGFIFYNALSFIIGLSLVNLAIQKGGASFFTVVSNLVPVFSVIFAYIFLHDVATIFQIIGGVIIITSIFLFQKK